LIFKKNYILTSRCILNSAKQRKQNEISSEETDFIFGSSKFHKSSPQSSKKEKDTDKNLFTKVDSKANKRQEKNEKEDKNLDHSTENTLKSEEGSHLKTKLPSIHSPNKDLKGEIEDIDQQYEDVIVEEYEYLPDFVNLK